MDPPSIIPLNHRHLLANAADSGNAVGSMSFQELLKALEERHKHELEAVAVEDRDCPRCERAAEALESNALPMAAE
eukprot:CAMPEP_0180655618 /NCGR_PEP_ID=MMETSP1037_2-20121125/55376_1 /TAXON_ID=632150 /ORGANISM="Azadinium spinosum, Strain 3D9" /LENGTH=75 /DNA_ID=CAMNT_0022682069 /DNA_START=17 /DNA_END=241 /DNA_ORIENTATION=+